jgi:uncharacterized membrane protein YdjX (TVP38/TMEM64 family)
VRSALLRLLALALVIAIGAIAYADRSQFQTVNFQAILAGNPWAPVVFVLAHIIVSLVFIPRTFLAITAGLIFGLWAGIALATIGALAGSIVCFVLMRYLHRGLFAFDGKRGLAWLARVKKQLDGGGWRGVALVRLLPMPHTPVNYAFALTDISLGDYVWGSLVGLLPMTVFWVDFGTAGERALDGSAHWLEPTLVGLAAVGASIALPRLLGWLRRR